MAYKLRLADINDKGVYFYVYTGNRRLFYLKDTMVCSKTSKLKFNREKNS